jgi:glutathione peroxidase-family protein
MGDFSYDGESICKGADICALYQFLLKKAKNGLQDSDVEWNFQNI